MEGNYSTVDEDIRKSSNEIFSMEDNYKTVELVEHLERNCSHRRYHCHLEEKCALCFDQRGDFPHCLYRTI
jgi:hypothetical protein